jgi:peptidyl-tRNA hydrolase, PTH1 family
MKIIACLGNPGSQYRNTRHNAGFLAGEYCAQQYGIDIGKKGFSARYGTGRSGMHELLFLFPQAYMNISGESVQGALTYYKTDEQDLIVIHDEIELPFGDIRMKKGGGHKGHNGLRSIIQKTGSADFERLRIGVGRPPDERIPVADFLLSDFTREESDRLTELFPRVKEVLDGMLA